MKNNNFLKTFFLSTLLFSYLDAGVLLFSEAYALALKNANEIKSSEYQAQASEQRVKQERSKLYPQVSISGYYSKTAYKQNNARKTTIRQGLFNGTLSVQQSLYNADTYSRIDMEKTRGRLYKAGVDLDKEQLAQKVFEAYLNLLKSDNKVDLYKSYLQYNKSKVQQLTKKYELHLANKMDYLQMKVEYNSANIDLIKELKLNKVYKLKLNQLIGDTDYELPNMRSDANIVDSIAAMKESLVEDGALSKNLKVKQAQISLTLSQYTIDNSYDAYMPRLDFQVSESLYATDTPTIDAPYSSIRQARILLNIPIYDGGMTSSRIEAAKLMKKSAYEDLLQEKKDQRVNYDEQKAIFDASAESVSMYKEAYESAKVYLDAIEQGFSHGLKSVTDLNEARNKLYEVKYKYIQNIYEMVNSYINLLIVTNNFDNIDLLDKLIQ